MQFAEYVLHWDLDVGEVEFGSVGHPQTQLVELAAYLVARRLGVDHQQ